MDCTSGQLNIYFYPDYRTSLYMDIHPQKLAFRWNISHNISAVYNPPIFLWLSFSYIFLLFIIPPRFLSLVALTLWECVGHVVCPA